VSAAAGAGPGDRGGRDDRGDRGGRGGPPVVRVLVADLSRSGVPVVLERYLAALDPERRTAVHVVAGRGGPVGDDLRRLGVTVVELAPPDGRTAVGTMAAGLAQLGARGPGGAVDRWAGRVAVRGLPTPDVVLLHGAGGILLRDLVPDGVPTVVHLHELATGLGRSGRPADVRDALRSARAVLAVAGPTAALAMDLGAAPGLLSIVPGVVDDRGPAPDRAAARARLAVRDGETVVGGAGLPGWRKGTGRLPTISRELGRRLGPVEVVWVGGRPVGAQADRRGVDDGVRWEAERDHPWELLDGADVVVVPSREDPLPLVALEAGGRGVPVVATATGGLPALLGGGRGLVVGPYDLVGLVDALAARLADPAAGAQAADALRRHVAAEYSASVVVPYWWALLVEAASGRSPR
jgi:hypothetical protein